MPNTTVDSIVARTLKKISERLENMAKKTKVEPTEEIISDVLHDPIYDAFREVSKDQINDLYKKLSLKLHPDKLSNNKKDDYAIKLNKYIDRVRDEVEKTKLRQIAQRFLNKNQNLPSFMKIVKDQNEGFQTLFEIFLARFHEFFNEYLRYPIYLKNFIYFTQAFINVILIIACVFVLINIIPVILIVCVNAFIEKNILSWLLSNHYQDVLNEELTEEKLAADYRKLVAYYRNILSAINQFVPGFPDFSNETDAVVLEYFGKTNEELNDMILKNAENSVTLSLCNWNFVLNAVYRATIADPQSGFILNNLYRIFVLLSLIPLLILKGSFFLVVISTRGLFLAALIILATIKLGSTLLFNAPLYVYDLFLLCFKNDEKLDVESRSRSSSLSSFSSQTFFSNNEKLDVDSSSGSLSLELNSID